MDTAIEVFVNEEEGLSDAVVLILRDPSITEYEGELVPACSLNPDQARYLADCLLQCAEQIEQS